MNEQRNDIKDNSIELYTLLREEILLNIEKQATYTNYAYIITAAIWAATFSINEIELTKHLLFFSPIILLPLCFRIADCRYSLSFISMYQSMILEPHLLFKWETKRGEYYKRNKRLRLDSVIYHGSKLDIPFLSLISIVMFWVISKSEIRLCWAFAVEICLQIAAVCLQTYVCLFYSDVNKIKKRMFSNWEVIQDANTSQQTAVAQ